MQQFNRIRAREPENASASVRSLFRTLPMIGILALCCCGASLGATHSNTAPTNIQQANSVTRQEIEMNIQTLTEQILAHNVSISSFAKEIGTAANDALIKLAKNEDDEVRQIVMYCLRETGGDDALEAFMHALHDSDSQVRGAAVAGLNHHATATLANPLMKQLPKIEDAYVRQQVALLIGKIGNPKTQTLPLNNHCMRENDADAKEGCIAALAKFGDANAQKLFSEQLKSSRNKTRARYLEYCKYLHESWLLDGLALVLDDSEPMIRIGVDGLPNYPEYLRANDIAVNLIASITSHKFSFDIAKNKNYNSVEINEVKSFVSKK